MLPITNTFLAKTEMLLIIHVAVPETETEVNTKLRGRQKHDNF